MALGLAESLSTLVKRKYTAAQAAGALSFAASELSIVMVGDVRYQLRYCPSLAKKPGKEQGAATAEKRTNPFEKPAEDLLVGYVPHGPDATHAIVLNKFPIIREHFILATKQWKEQSQLLEQTDLEVAYGCLKAWEEGDEGGKLFAFFNSGEHSGASQAHRHLQFLPVEAMQEGCAEGEWSLLADDIVLAPDTETGELSYFRSHKQLPFQHFGTRLPPEPSGETLHQVYLNLYQQCLSIAHDYMEDHPGEFSFHSGEGQAAISYNLAMTSKSMVMCPRRHEGLAVQAADGGEAGFAALNGTMLGGTMMVKQGALYERLQGDGETVQRVFEAAGLPARMRRITSYLSL